MEMSTRSPTFADVLVILGELLDFEQE